MQQTHLPFKTASTGSTVTWNNVLPSTYKVRGMRSTDANCNGILPGKGTYTVTYTATSTN